MEQNIQSVFYQMSLLNDLMDQVDADDSTQVILFCENVISFLRRSGLVCSHYGAYKQEWERFNETKDVSNKNLNELCVYLLIYARCEHMAGDYGSCYVNAFRSGAIPALVREIVRKTEGMAISLADDTDKTGRIGIAGEYFVVAELTRRGYVASLTSKNTKAVDILASDKNGRQQVAIQVKTCNNAKQCKWKMSDAAEMVDAANLYYVFVNMNGGGEPSYYIVPSKYVAYRIREDYLTWLNTPGKKGQKRNETTMRTFSLIDEEERNYYQDAWHLLGI